MAKIKAKGIPASEVFGEFTEADVTLLIGYAKKVLSNKARGRKTVAKAILRALDRLGRGEDGNKRYTISTQEFKSLAAAEAKIKEWHNANDLTEGTKVFEVTGVIYKPEIKLVKEVKNHGR